MKRLSGVVLLISLSLIAFKSNSQDRLATYENTYVNRTYNVEISKEKDGAFILYIDGYSSTYETGGLRINSDQHADFVTAMLEAKTKYLELVRNAKSKNVTSLNKEMAIEVKTGGFFQYAGDWRFQYAVNPTFHFKALEKGGNIEYFLIVSTGELTASNNKFMKADGFTLTFRSADEIDAFTNSISTRAINEFKKPVADALLD